MNWLRKLFGTERSPYVHLVISDMENKKIVVTYGKNAAFIGRLDSWTVMRDTNGSTRCLFELTEEGSLEKRYRVDS